MKTQKLDTLRKIINKEEPVNTAFNIKHIPASEKENDTVAALMLEVVYKNKLLFQGKLHNYYVLGELPQDMASLQVTLLITEPTSDRRERYKLDLYEREEVKQCIKAMTSRFNESEGVLEAELLMLTDLVEKYRDSQVEEQQVHTRTRENLRMMVPAEERAAIEFLSAPDLMERTYELLEKAWAVGNMHICKMVFMAMASYKTSTPIHIALFGSSINVKEFMDRLARLMPPEDIVCLNDISGRSLYHCTNGELVNKVLLLPNGLDKKANRALNLLRQGVISTATTVKDRLGNMVSTMKQVKSHFSSVIYEDGKEKDNSRVLPINMGESQSSMETAVHYENIIFAGMVDSKQEEKAMEQVRNIIRCIKPMEIVNPNANAITLAQHNNVFLKMNHIYNSLVRQVCLLHQYQRKRDSQDRLIAELEDMKTAGELLFNTMTLESEDLDPVLEELYDGIKTYVKEKAGDKAKDYQFTQREIRHALNLSKNYCFRYMQELHRLEYLERVGYANCGYKYKVTFGDETAAENIRNEIKGEFYRQLRKLGGLPRKAS